MDEYYHVYGSTEEIIKEKLLHLRQVRFDGHSLQELLLSAAFASWHAAFEVAKYFENLTKSACLVQHPQNMV